MKAVFINLDRSPGRRDFMQAQSARLGLGLARIVAVDGRDIPQAEHDRLCPVPAVGKRLASSELGCYLSHMQAWRTVLEAGGRFGAVFEDDVFLADDTADFLGTEDWIPEGADLVRLSSNARRLTLAAEPAGERHGRRLLRLHSRTVDIGGYVIAAAHARRLLDRGRHFETPVDRLLLDPPSGAAIYQLSPSLAVQAKWADFGFLPEAEAHSQVQTEKPPHRREPPSLAKLGRELEGLRQKVLKPLVMPLAQPFRPRSRRVRVAAVPFRK